MFRLSESTTLNHRAAIVWPYLVAFEQIPLWEHGVLAVRRKADGPPRVGDPIEARRIYAGRQTRLDGHISEFEGGIVATLQLRGGPLADAWVQYRVEPIDDRRARVTYSAWGALRGPLGLLHPIVPAIGRTETRKNLAKLARRIDAGVPATSEMDAG
jgi:hypothetical protein